jgi:alpha-amylase
MQLLANFRAGIENTRQGVVPTSVLRMHNSKESTDLQSSSPSDFRLFFCRIRSCTRVRLLLLFPLLLFSFSPLLSAKADVLLQGFYWDVPSPAAGQANAPWWWDKLASQANSLRKAGFTAVWIPPVLKSNSGGFSVGYDPFDDYDIGAKNQKGTVPTRYGTREQLQRCVAIMRANGLDIYLDIVQNHRNGDDGQFQFRYANAYGKPAGGRFPKNPGDFHPNVPQDPNVPLGNSEYQFGRDIAHVNGKNGYIGRGMIAAGDWLTRTLDAQGYRIDYVKGISSDWLKQFLNSGAMRGKFAIGEYYDGDLGLVRDWVTNKMNNRVSAFDFPLRGLLKEMCDGNGNFDMRRLNRAGLAGVDPFHAVTFVENHDTDRDSPIVRGKMLAYAYILTAEGYPSVFYRDYMDEPNCYKLKKHLDPLVWIHEKLASGKTQERWSDSEVFVFERMGGKRLLVGLNDQGNPQTVRVQTSFGTGVLLHDYTGHAPDVVTERGGTLTLTLPSNRDGDGYVCYAPAGISGGFAVMPKRTTQEFFAARDLDIRPAEPGVETVVGRVYPAAGSKMQIKLAFDTTRIFRQATVQVWVSDSSGRKIAAQSFTPANLKTAVLTVPVSRSGAHTIRLRADRLPPDSQMDYRLTANYLASSR